MLDITNIDVLQQRFPWLTQTALAVLPAQVKQDGEARAVERFFTQWIVYPDAVSQGYMHHLPLLYDKSDSNSVLRLSVLALAYGESRDYGLKGLQNYGAAIARLQVVVKEPDSVDDDQLLAAILLIDAFETLHVSRNKPLGLHDKALQYVLQTRGIDQLYSTRRFCLFQAAMYRLYARQLLLGEDSGMWQQTLLVSLNQERPELRVMHDVSQIIDLRTRADGLTRHPPQNVGAQVIMHQVSDLLQEGRSLISSIEEWTFTLDDRLKPKSIVSDRLILLDQEPASIGQYAMGIHGFPCPRMLRHHDVTLAFLWSFYAAAQIILRAHIVQLLQLAASLSHNDAQQYIDRTQGERLAIDGLSASIIRSIPQLMGLDVDPSPHIPPRAGHLPASSLGHFLGVFAMIVVKQTEGTSEIHKQSAESMLAWIHKHYQAD